MGSHPSKPSTSSPSMPSSPSSLPPPSVSSSPPSLSPPHQDHNNTTLRANMEKEIQCMVDKASKEEMDGDVSIVYESIGDFEWLFGSGDGESWRELKHWRLVIKLGFDCFTLEFLENSIVSHEGVVVVGPFDHKARGNKTLYPLGDLKALSTEVLYNWIQKEFRSRTEYNVIVNNCHQIVHKFLEDFEKSGHLTRTNHMAASKVWSGVPKLDPIYRQLFTFGELIGAVNYIFKSTSKQSEK